MEKMGKLILWICGDDYVICGLSMSLFSDQTLKRLSAIFDGDLKQWLTEKLLPLVESVMEGYHDPSHDMFHVERVLRVALELAESIWSSCRDGTGIQFETNQKEFLTRVALVALCHDVGDHKYEDSERLKSLVAAELEAKMGKEMSDRVFEIGGCVSWSREQREIREFGRAFAFPDPVDHAVLSCVQDSDRLDAIGAVGFARCVAFGASNDRLGFTRVIDHWHEKLKRIPEFMKTPEGHCRAEERVAILGTMIYALEREISM